MKYSRYSSAVAVCHIFIGKLYKIRPQNVLILINLCFKVFYIAYLFIAKRFYYTYCLYYSFIRYLKHFNGYLFTVAYRYGRHCKKSFVKAYTVFRICFVFFIFNSHAGKFNKEIGKRQYYNGCRYIKSSMHNSNSHLRYRVVYKTEIKHCLRTVKQYTEHNHTYYVKIKVYCGSSFGTLVCTYGRKYRSYTSTYILAHYYRYSIGICYRTRYGKCLQYTYRCR